LKIFIDSFVLELYNLLLILHSCSSVSHSNRFVEQCVSFSKDDHDFYFLIKYLIFLDSIYNLNIKEFSVYGANFNSKEIHKFSEKIKTNVLKIDSKIKNPEIGILFKDYNAILSNFYPTISTEASFLDLQIGQYYDNNSREKFMQGTQEIQKNLTEIITDFTSFVNSKALINSLSRTYFVKKGYGHDFIFSLITLKINLENKENKIRNYWDFCIYLVNIENDIHSHYRLNTMSRVMTQFGIDALYHIYQWGSKINFSIYLLTNLPIWWDAHLDSPYKDKLTKFLTFFNGKKNRSILNEIKTENQNNQEEIRQKQLETQNQMMLNQNRTSNELNEVKQQQAKTEENILLRQSETQNLIHRNQNSTDSLSKKVDSMDGSFRASIKEEMNSGLKTINKQIEPIKETLAAPQKTVEFTGGFLKSIFSGNQMDKDRQSAMNDLLLGRKKREKPKQD
jgi:hypothetical protein